MRHFIQRLLMLPVLLVLISLLAFVLVRLAPGGPFDRERVSSSPDIERNLKAKYHLDESILKQYGRFLGGLLKGDLGPSLKYRSHTVNDIIAQGLPVSLALGFSAFGLALGLGVPMGFYAAIHRGEWTDHGILFLSLLLICVPAFIIGPVLIMVFAIWLGWFPVALWESWAHAVLPVATLGLYFSGRIARLMREGMQEVLQAPFIRTARAKGLGETAVWVKHALRLGFLPVASYSGPLLAELLTGSFVVENLFQIPGIGVFLVNSSLSRDYTMVVGLVGLYAVLLIVLNLMIDALYLLLDPRVRYE